MAFQKLVRYEQNGQKHYGDILKAVEGGYSLARLEGVVVDKLARTDDVVTVPQILCPLESAPIIICVGLNYRQHAEEANARKLEIPKYPVIFTKPSDALAGPLDKIYVHPDAQGMLDYEGELCVVMARDAKNVPESTALDYVLGYAVGNDVSARNFQMPEASGGQFGYSKSFDGFAPIGPAVWSKELVPDPQKLSYRTKVNGRVVQNTSTADMIWTVRQLIAHLSRGTTLRAGTVIMTGTPSGVGYFRGDFLQNGDVVEVEADGLGKISNTIVFEA